MTTRLIELAAWWSAYTIALAFAWAVIVNTQPFRSDETPFLDTEEGEPPVPWREASGSRTNTHQQREPA